jgi:hypothetical protein
MRQREVNFVTGLQILSNSNNINNIKGSQVYEKILQL